MAKKKLTEEEKLMRKSETKRKADKFFVTILVLFVLCGIGYVSFIMYKNGGINFINNKKNAEKKEKEEKEKETAVPIVAVNLEEGSSYFTFNNYILVTAKKDVFGLIYLYNLDGEQLVQLDEPLEFQYYYVNEDGNLCLIQEEHGEGSVSNIIVYELNGKEFKKTLELEGNKSYFVSLILTDADKNDKLIGFVEVVNEDDYKNSYKIHYMNGKTVDLGSYEIHSVHAMTSAEEGYQVYNSQYAVVRDSNIRNSKYGVVNLKTGELVVGLNYNLLRQTYDNNYIAKMDGETGIIDLKTKKILPYEYDFIDMNKDYYILSKNNKMAIVDKDYKFVTDFEFDYQTNKNKNEYSYDLCCTNYNTFVTQKYDDKYFLAINFRSEFDYPKDEAYIINKDGTYETIQENSFEFFDDFVYLYDENNKVIHVYDDSLELMYDISLSDYDLKGGYVSVSKHGNDLLRIDLNGTIVYYDFESGEEIEEEPFGVYTKGNVKFEHDITNGKLKFYYKDKEVEELTMDLEFQAYSRQIQKLKNGNYLISDKERFIIVK